MTALDSEPTDEPDLVITAYRLPGLAALRIIPATNNRNWMVVTPHRFAYRCLPLVMANQAGWFILNSHSLQVTWSGGKEQSSLRVEYLKGSEPYPATSHFGCGIVTWHIPYLFRTPPGYDLLVRGPSNYPKDGIMPLEGLVETDWTPASFTMNWMMTSPSASVIFDIDEPIAMIVPQKRGLLERFKPKVSDIETNPAVALSNLKWSESRQNFIRELPKSGETWEKHYFLGTSPDGTSALPGLHRTKLSLGSFINEPNSQCLGEEMRHDGAEAPGCLNTDESIRAESEKFGTEVHGDQPRD